MTMMRKKRLPVEELIEWESGIAKKTKKNMEDLGDLGSMKV